MYKKPENIINFRYWCHKVLPLVYDDSLSYYELLCKVMKKLDEIIEQVNDIDLSELYALIKAIMEMVSGGEYNFDTNGNYDTTKSYVRDDYVIYENKLYRCDINTTGDFDPAKWVEINIGDELKYIYNKAVTTAKNSATRFSYSGSFRTFKQKSNADDYPSDEAIERFTLSDEINNFKEDYDITMSDTNRFPVNSIVTDNYYNTNAETPTDHFKVYNAPPFEDYMYNIITFGGQSSIGEVPSWWYPSLAEYYDGATIQIAIPVYQYKNTMEHKSYNIMWRYSSTTEIEGGTHWHEDETYFYSPWYEIGSDIPDFDNLDSVIGATAFAYDSTHTYNEGDYCTVNDSNTVTMYKANQTTTGTFDNSKWTATNIINELKNALIILHSPNGTFRNGAIPIENAELSE